MVRDCGKRYRVGLFNQLSHANRKALLPPGKKVKKSRNKCLKVEEELITENPFIMFKMAKEAVRQFKSISQTHVVQLINSLESSENTLNPSWFWITVIRTFYYTGIRRRQLTGLTWSDIDFENTLFFFNQNTVRHYVNG